MRVRKMKTLLVSLSAALLLPSMLGTAPIASADHCGSTHAILNQAIGTDIPLTITPQTHPGGCAAHEVAPQEAVDSRILWPGASFVQPTYIKDLGQGTPRLEAELKGAGFSTFIQLTRQTTDYGVFYLPSETWYRIPQAPVTPSTAISMTIYRPATDPVTQKPIRVKIVTTTFKTPA